MTKITVAFVCAAVLGLSPTAGWAQDRHPCQPKFEAEVRPLNEQYKNLADQISELWRRYDKAQSRGEKDSIRQQIDSAKKQQEDVHKQVDEAAKRMARCMGMPVTKEEAQQREREFKARMAEQERKWKGMAKQYEDAQRKALAGGAGRGFEQSTTAGSGRGLVDMPAIPGAEGGPSPSSPTGMPGARAEKTPAQKAAALAAVNAELDRLPLRLPKQADAPSADAILKLAAARHAAAKQGFRPAELSAYARGITWVPRFDGRARDAKKARRLSLPVASVTSYFNLPRFMMAFAAAVFALDPQSPAAASNLASAIVTAGQRLNPGAGKDKALLPYRRDAEACLRYALARSMKAEKYTDASLTALLNLGNLYLDLGKLEEARSLFQVARKQSPFNWDAALAMAAYFHAVKKPDQAQAILDDEKLDRPQILMVAKKHAKALEKSDEVPPDSPDTAYQENLKAVNSEPIATAADFMAQIDQSARNKLRYFVEHLPPKGSFAAPSIKKLTQYATLRAISRPPGISALKDFGEMLQIYALKGFASQAGEQTKMLKRLGLKLDTGVDFEDVARNPQKYVQQKGKKGKKRPKVKVDKRELMANLERWKKDAKAAQNDLATGKTGKAVALAAEVDPFFAILKVDPEEWADPMNVIVQKHNFAVHNRKRNLYTGYLHSLNKKLRFQFTVIAENYGRKVLDAEKVRDAELKELEARKVPGAEGLILKHRIHVKFFNTANNAAETAFGSATNVASTTYVNKIKPTVEAFYYDVIRHVGLISDPEVRDRKDAELKQAIYSALVTALSTVGAAHGSFQYHPEWECGCDLGQLLAQREAEEKQKKEEEWARLQRNKAAKAVFDSGEIPRSSQLWKRLDGYGFDFDYFFISGRMSCARTVVRLKLPLPGGPEVFLQTDKSEFGGAAIHDQGIKLSKDVGPAKAVLELKANQVTDGQGVVRDWSVTAATGLEVEQAGMTARVGGQLTFGPNGFRGGDFSAGIEKEFKEQLVDAADAGTEGKTFEAVVKLGSLFAGKVAESLLPDREAAERAKANKGKDKPRPKEIWPGTFEAAKPK